MIRSLVLIGGAALFAVAASAQPAQDPPAKAAPPASAYGVQTGDGWVAPARTTAKRPASQDELDALNKSGRHGRRGDDADRTRPRSGQASGTDSQARSAKRPGRMERRHQQAGTARRLDAGGHRGGRHRGRGRQVGPSYGRGF